MNIHHFKGFPCGSAGKESPCNVGDLGLIPPRRKWQPTPVLLPAESHGRRSLVGFSPRVAKSRTQLSNFTFTFTF